MRPAAFVVAVLAVVIASSVPARAHHSHPAFYDSCTSVTIEGQIDSVQWKNPHVLLDVTTTDGKAYRADWTSIGALERNKIEPPKAGDRVVITGNPMRDVASIRGRFPTLTIETPAKPVVDVGSIRGASGNWSWKRNEPETAPSCGGK
ncbi:MAG TPA: DUF6152 family protein [Vicinamibacterales bacterium]|nr:DUF6152 family protein [Vicinamibacterales bacterium]